MIYVGIDVAKDKHDCFITNSDGEILFKVFTIANNLDGFNNLYQKIEAVMKDITNVKVGLEATIHYSYNLLGYLFGKGLTTFVINPLHTNLYRKSLSLRQTKTDKVDARTIASMLMSDVNLKSYSDISYHNEELKSLTRYRFDSPDKILAYAGFSPSTYQSGQLDGAYSHMKKRGSRYLRYALYNAAKYVCHWNPTFAEYLSKKRSEGKHYNVAVSHAVKNRVIYHLEKTNQKYVKAA